MTTEAQKRATAKYNEKFFMVRFRMPLLKYDTIKTIAAEKGESIATMFNRLADEEINKHNKKTDNNR